MPMSKLDPFTVRRLWKFIEDFRQRQGQLPTLRDLETGGFDREVVELATREKVVDSLYVTLTNGAIVKGFKARHD